MYIYISYLHLSLKYLYYLHYDLLKTVSKGKFWKSLFKISVKAVETRSLMTGLSTRNPGCHAVLINRSNMFSVTHVDIIK